ncbi:MAG: response regulator [Nitrospirae bacterium]|nr:response regulator [Nitrospirota bacterium]
MVIVIVLLTVVVFFVVDLLLRLALKKKEEGRLRRERGEALDTGLKLDYTDEAASLKRVEVDSPKARILAVDDEPVVLDSFRKILILEGYSIDTVETAQEALGLVRKHDYDFVFTDLKMPGMDGLDLTKAVKHVRPDIDVVMITGYGTIESAVDTMRFGAMDYVEKPFTPDELAAFTNKCLIRRRDRVEKETAPRVQLVTAAVEESHSPNVINVPGGIYVSPEHTWVGIDITGEARVGLDDFALKSIEDIRDVDFPAQGSQVRKGEPLFTLRRGERALIFPSPLTGRVTGVNHDLTYYLELVTRRPFALGWICCLEPSKLSQELGQLKIGADALPWYESEIRDFWNRLTTLRKAEEESERATARSPEEAKQKTIELAWSVFGDTFVGPSHTPAPVS